MKAHFCVQPCKPSKLDKTYDYKFNVMSKNNILLNLEKTKEELEAAYSCFDNVLEPDLIDYHIYQINALKMRHKHLMDLLAQHYENNQLCALAPV